MIKRALRNLPKTLYETYNKIFEAIPDEDRTFVYHVLHWIEMHDLIFPKFPIPCHLLLQGIAISIVRTLTEESERFYDVYTLRELCGCLVRVSYDEEASFAHYTVKEYLETRRDVPIGPGPPMLGYNSRHDVLHAIYWEACQSKSSSMLQKLRTVPDEAMLVQALSQNISSYCVISALILMRMDQSDDLVNDLALTILDPSSSHYTMLISGLKSFIPDSGWFENFSFIYLHSTCMFWKRTWCSPPHNLKAVHLMNALLYFNQYPILAKKVLECSDGKVLLNTRFHFRWDLQPNDSGFVFDGNVIELFAQLGLHRKAFAFLLEMAETVESLSRVLLLHLGFHDHQYCVSELVCEGCPIQLLLRMGADLNGTDYVTTPLQIAAWCGDLSAVDQLLKAGADPNSTGNHKGKFWGLETLQEDFNDLLGDSPLTIYRDNHSGELESAQDDVAQIEKLLLQHGAIERSVCPPLALDIENSFFC